MEREESVAYQLSIVTPLTAPLSAFLPVTLHISGQTQAFFEDLINQEHEMIQKSHHSLWMTYSLSQTRYEQLVVSGCSTQILFDDMSTIFNYAVVKLIQRSNLKDFFFSICSKMPLFQN